MDAATYDSLKKLGVTVTDFHSITLKCDKCGAEWTAVRDANGRFARGYWRCLNMCNAKDAT
jgi:hypothetical protein